MAGLGATQQATQQAGIAADQAAFNQERDNPYKMVQYQQSLLQGLPLAAQQYNTSTNPYYAAAGAAGDIGKTLGVDPNFSRSAGVNADGTANSSYVPTAADNAAWAKMAAMTS
jgi:hypothetical protein